MFVIAKVITGVTHLKPREDLIQLFAILIAEDIRTLPDAVDIIGSIEGIYAAAVMTTSCLFSVSPSPVHVCSEVIGESLGKTSKEHFALLTLKGKRALRSWPRALQEPTGCPIQGSPGRVWQSNNIPSCRIWH